MGPYEVAHAFLYSNANSSPDDETRTLARITLNEMERLRSIIERVRDLHANENGHCTECLDAYGEYTEWPCRTIKEIDENARRST